MGIKRDSFGVFWTGCLLIILELVIQITLARALGAEARGSFAVCWTFLSIQLMFCVFGIGDANTYSLASSKATVSQVLGANIYLAFLSCAIVGSISYQLIDLPYEFFSKASRVEFLWIIIALWPWVFSIYLISILRGKNLYASMNFIKLAAPVTSLLGLLVFCYFFRLGVVGAIMARISGPLTVIVFALVKLRSEIHLVELFTGGLKQISNTLHYAVRGFLGVLAQTMNIQLGTILMAFFLETSEVGFYAIAMAIVARIWVVPDSICTILMPNLAQKEEVSDEFISRILRLVIIIVSVVSVGVALISKPFIRFGFGVDFLPVVTAIYILLIGTVARSLTKIITAYLLAINRPGTNSAIKLIFVLFYIGLLFILIPRYGFVGGPLATSFSFVMEMLITILVFARISHLKSWRMMIIQKEDFRYIWSNINTLFARFKRQRQV